MPDAPTHDELVQLLAIYYAVNPRLFRRMDTPTLVHAWHITRLHDAARVALAG
jgi:hypothetical protein